MGTWWGLGIQAWLYVLSDLEHSQGIQEKVQRWESQRNRRRFAGHVEAFGVRATLASLADCHFLFSFRLIGTCVDLEFPELLFALPASWQSSSSSLLPHKDRHIFLQTSTPKQREVELHINCEVNHKLLRVQVTFEGRVALFRTTSSLLGISL